MDQDLKDYIYKNYDGLDLSNRDVEIIQDSYGFARYKACQSLGNLLDEIEGLINPKILKIIRWIQNILNKLKRKTK